MFKIDKQQMAAFAESSVRGFEQRMVQHLGEQFPKQCAALAATTGVETLVRKGIERAASHGITLEKDVSGFIGVMCVLGEAFDEDPKLPWVSEVLGNESTKSVTEKVDQLCKKASEHLALTSEDSGGEDALEEEEATAALTEERVKVGSFEPFSRSAEVGQPVVPCPKVVKKRLYFFSS
jgi:hypothetical protein